MSIRLRGPYHAAASVQRRPTAPACLLRTQQTCAVTGDVTERRLGRRTKRGQVTAISLGVARARSDNRLCERLIDAAVARADTIGEAGAHLVGVIVAVGRVRQAEVRTATGAAGLAVGRDGARDRLLLLSRNRGANVMGRARQTDEVDRNHILGPARVACTREATAWPHDPIDG